MVWCSNQRLEMISLLLGHKNFIRFSMTMIWMTKMILMSGEMRPDGERSVYQFTMRITRRGGAIGNASHDRHRSPPISSTVAGILPQGNCDGMVVGRIFESRAPTTCCHVARVKRVAAVYSIRLFTNPDGRF